VIHRALTRAVSTVTFTSVVLALRSATAAPLTAARAGTARFDELLGLVAAAGCWTLLGWVALVLGVTALGSIPGALGRFGTAAAARLTPIAMRGAARLVLGLAVVAGPVTVAVPVNATPVAAHAITLHGSAAADVLSLPDVGRPGWSESARTVMVANRPGSAGSPQTEVVTVVVRPGDCLWTITAEALAQATDAEPSDAAVAAEWPRWYALNRRTIGSDPDLLLPGMVLRAPMAQ
jgi:nucleoid-associated protein YgaU